MEQPLVQGTNESKRFRGWLALGLIGGVFVAGSWWVVPEERSVASPVAIDAELVSFVWEQSIANVPQVAGRKFTYTIYSSVDYVAKQCGTGQMWHCQDFTGPNEPWGSDSNKPPPGAVGALVSLGGSGGNNWDKLDGAKLGRKLEDTGYAGVDLDWETELNKASGDRIVQEMGRMRASFPGLKIVSTIMGSYAATDHKLEWDIMKALHENGNLDYIGLMMYGLSMVGNGWSHENTRKFIRTTLDYAQSLGIPMAKIFLALTTTGCDDEFVKIFAGFIAEYKLAGYAWWQGNGLPSEEWLDVLGHASTPTPPSPTPTPPKPPSPTPSPPNPPSPGTCPYSITCVDHNDWYAKFTISEKVSSAESTQGSHTKEWRLDAGQWYLEPAYKITDEDLTVKMQPNNVECEIPSPSVHCR